jgi:hypothetical protein
MNVGTPKRKGGPRQKRLKSPTGGQQVFKLDQWQQSFDVQAFNRLIEGQGVYVTHYRAIPDPTGMASIGDVHAVQSDKRSSDGFIYKEIGKLYLSFSNNTSDWNIEVEGMVKHDVSICTPQMQYENCDKPVLLAPYDRFYLEDIEMRVVAMQYVEANTIGIDKLQYPATCVEHLIDADGKEYQENVDFSITAEGFIKWLTQNRPGYNPKTMKGTVYSIRYRYTPYFIVARLLHEVRVSQVTNPNTFQRTLERMPYQCMVIREHVLSDLNNDPNQDIMDIRYQNASTGGFIGSDNNGSEGGKL